MIVSSKLELRFEQVSADRVALLRVSRAGRVLARFPLDRDELLELVDLALLARARLSRPVPRLVEIPSAPPAPDGAVAPRRGGRRHALPRRGKPGETR